MPKIDTYGLNRTANDPLREYCVQDPKGNPDKDINVAFRKLGSIDALNLPAETEAIITRYIRGVKIEEVDPTTKAVKITFDKPEMIPPLGDQPVTISPHTAHVIAILKVSQHTVNPDDMYEAWEWAHILTVDAFAVKFLRIIADHIMADIADDSWLTEPGGDESNPLAETGDREQASSTTSPES